MGNIGTTVTIVALSGVSVLAAAYGSARNLLLLVAGALGIMLTTLAIFNLHYSRLRVILHLLILVVFSIVSYYIIKKYLTNNNN